MGIYSLIMPTQIIWQKLLFGPDASDYPFFKEPCNRNRLILSFSFDNKLSHDLYLNFLDNKEKDWQSFCAALVSCRRTVFSVLYGSENEAQGVTSKDIVAFGIILPLKCLNIYGYSSFWRWQNWTFSPFLLSLQSKHTVAAKAVHVNNWYTPQYGL